MRRILSSFFTPRKRNLTFAFLVSMFVILLVCVGGDLQNTVVTPSSDSTTTGASAASGRGSAHSAVVVVSADGSTMEESNTQLHSGSAVVHDAEREAKAAAIGAALVADEQESSSSSTTSSSSSSLPPSIFVPEDDWKEILPGQQIPAGLDIRMDFQTGVKHARLIPLADRSKYRQFPSTTSSTTTASKASGSVNSITPIGNSVDVSVASHSDDSRSSSTSSITSNNNNNNNEKNHDAEGLAVDHIEEEEETLPLDPEIASTLAALNASSARMATILLGLPEPMPEVEDAILTGMPPEKLAAIVKRVWDARQESLRVAFASAKTEGAQMQELLAKLVSPSSGLSTSDIVTTLEDLEFFVATIHNAEDFAAMGGLVTAVNLLNHTHLPIAAHAAWVLGTAVKGHAGLQIGALDAGAAPALVKLMNTASLAMVTPISEEKTTSRVLDSLKVANKGLYALSGLIRYNPLAQQAVVHAQAHEALLTSLTRSTSALLLGGVDASISGGEEGGVSWTPVMRQAGTLARKIVTLLSDLAGDEADAIRRSKSVDEVGGGVEEGGEDEGGVLRVKLGHRTNAAGSNETYIRSITAEHPEAATPLNGGDTAASSSLSSSSSGGGPAMTRVDVDKASGSRRAVHLAWDQGATVPGTASSKTRLPLLEAFRVVVSPTDNTDTAVKTSFQSKFCDAVQNAVAAVNSLPVGEPDSTEAEIVLALTTAATAFEAACIPRASA